VADTQARIVLTGVDRSGAAFQSAKRNLESLQTSTTALVGRFAAIGAAISTALGAASLKGAIDAGDEIGKLAQKTGITTESLSGLKLAADLSDVSTDSLAKGIKTLSINMAAAAGGSKEAQQTFSTLGVNFKNADGSLRGIDDVLGDVADKFAGFEDGAEKAALAAEVFGTRAGPDLIPFLNLGRKGIEDTRKEAEQLGVVFGSDFAKAAEQFNDNLTRLGTAALGAKIALADQLLPTLNATLEAFVKNTKAAGLFMGALLTLGQGLSQRLGLDELGQLQSKAAGISTEIERVTNVMAGLANVLARDPGNEQAQRRYDNLRDKLRGLQGQALATGDAIKKLANDATASATPPGKAADGPKKPAPIKPAGGAAATSPDQVALFRTQLQARQQTIQQTLNNEQDILRFNEQFVQEIYRSGNTSLESAFQAQDELRRRNVEEIRRASEATIQAEQDFQAQLPKPKDAAGRQRNEVEVQQSEARITAARVKLQAAEREFEQATSLAAVQRPEQREQLSQQVQQFEAALQDMVTGGRARAGELADIAVQTREATRLLIEGGTDPAVAQQRAQVFGQQLERQRDLNLARDRFADVTRRASEEEERFVIAANARGDSQAEVERGLFEIRARTLSQMGEMVRKAEELAASADPDSPAVQFARELRLEFERLNAVVDPALTRLRAVGDEVADALGQAAGAISINFKDARSAVKSLGDQLLAISTRELVTNPLTDIFRKTIRGATEGDGALAGVFGKIFGVGARAPALPAPTLPTAGGGGLFGGSGFFGAGPLTGAGESGGVPNDLFGDIFGKAAEAVTGLGGAADGTGSVLGRLPQLAAIPATTSLSALAGAAQAAAQALLQIGAGGALGGAGGLGNVFGSFGLQNLQGGGFGTGFGFGLQDLALFFEDGGYTGNKGTKQPAGVVHGKEFVFSAPAVQALGVDKLDALHAAAKNGRLDGLPGYEQGGYVDVLAAGLPSWSVPTDSAALAPLDRSLGPAADGGRADMVAQALEYPFADLERFHSGGISSEEQLAVVLRNEEILTASDPRHSDNGGGGDTYIDMRGLKVDSHGYMDPTAEDRAAQRIARKAQRFMSRKSA
jgi:hypothetical protein